MKKNATIEQKGNGEWNIKTVENKKVLDPVFPWIKKSTSYRIKTPNNLFGKYIAFYSTIISSGNESNIITTDSIIAIGRHYDIAKCTVENCIKELVMLEELIKVKRGIYMLNPHHISGGRTAQASQDLIDQAKQIVNTQNNNSNNTTNIIISESSSKELLSQLLEKKHEQDKLNLSKL